MTLLYSADFTSGVVPDDLPVVGANGATVTPPYGASPIPGFLEIATAPDGTLCLQSTTHPSDTITNGGYRSEVGWNSEGQGHERWYSVDVFFAAGINTVDNVNFMQLHDQYDDATDTLYGSGHEKFVNAAFQFQNHKVLVFLPDYVRATGLPDDSKTVGRLVASVPMIFDRWAKLVVHANWQTTSAGWIEAWYDGRKIMSEWTKPAAYVDPTGPLMRFGSYTHQAPPTLQTRIWYKNARIYDGAGETHLSMLGAAEKCFPAAIII